MTVACEPKYFRLAPWHWKGTVLAVWSVHAVSSEPCCELETLSTVWVRAAHYTFHFKLGFGPYTFQYLLSDPSLLGFYILLRDPHMECHPQSKKLKITNHFICSHTLGSRSTNLSNLLLRKQIQSCLDNLKGVEGCSLFPFWNCQKWLLKQNSLRLANF